MRLEVSRPLVSALASAFLSSDERNSADFTGQRALDTPNCLPVRHRSRSVYCSSYASSHDGYHACSMLRTLRSTARAPSIPPHGHCLLVVLDIVEVGECALQLPAVDRLGGLAGVLEGAAEVGSAGARRFGGFEMGGCVADLNENMPC